MRRWLSGVFVWIVATLLVLSAAGAGNTAGPVQIKFATLGDPYPQYFSTLVQAFQKDNPGIQIAVESIPFNQYFDVVEARLTSGASDPDVLFVDQPLVMSYAARGFIAPLNPYVGAAQQQAFVPTLLDAGQVSGKLMAIPLQSSTQLLYYNVTLFQKAGVAVPSEDPAKRLTWEQVAETARKLTGPSQWGFAFEQVDRPYQLLPLPQSLGGKPIDPTGTRASGYVDAAPWLRAATFYSDLYNRWKISPPGVIYPQTDDLFEAGRIGMLLGTELQVNRFAKDRDLIWGIALHPYFAGKAAVTPTGSWYVGINKNSRQSEAAGRWTRFLASEGAGRMWYQVSGRLPAHKRILAEMEGLAATPIARTEARLAAYESTHTAVPRPRTVGYREWEDILYRAFGDIRNGADPTKTLQNAARSIDQALQKYR